MRSNEIQTNGRNYELEEKLRLTENKYIRSQETNRQLIIENSRLQQEKDYAFKRIAGLEQQLILLEKKYQDEKDILQYQMSQIRLQQAQPQQQQPRLTYVPNSSNNSSQRSSLNSKQSNSQIKYQLPSFENVEEEEQIGVFNTKQLQASNCTFASRNPFILGNNNNQINIKQQQQQQQSKRIEQYDNRSNLNNDSYKKDNQYSQNSPFSPKMAIINQKNDSFAAVSPVSNDSEAILEFVDDDEDEQGYGQEQIQNIKKSQNTMQIRSTSNRLSEQGQQQQQQYQRKEQKQTINNLPSYDRSYSNSGTKFQHLNQQYPGQVPEFNVINEISSHNSNTTVDTTYTQGQGNSLVQQQYQQGNYQQLWLQHKQQSENEANSSPFRLSEQNEQQSRIYGINSSHDKKQRKIFQIAPAKSIQRNLLPPVSPKIQEEIEQNNRIIVKSSDQQENKKISMFEVKPVILNNNLTFQKPSHNSLQEQYSLQYHLNSDSFDFHQNYFSSQPAENKIADRPEQKLQMNSSNNSTKSKIQSQQLKKSEVQFISENNLIENFYIFSADQRQLQDTATFRSKSEQILKPETIYSLFPNKLIDGNKIEEDLMRLAFPRGVEAKKKVQSDSMNDLQKIISLEKLRDIGQDGFVFVVKTQKSYEKKDNREDNMYKKQKDIIEEVNPNHLLYCICVCQRNFVLDKKKSDGSNEKDKKKKKKDEYFFDIEMAYCIVTKLPHVQYFIKVLESISNLFKIEKMNNYYQFDDLSQIDLFFFKLISNQLETKLNNLAQSKVPLPGFSFISEQLPNEVKQVTLEIEDLTKSCYMETYWGISKCFSRFQKSSDIIAIYAELLLEHSTIFVSESKTILSQYILLFHAMLQPLKWPHPIIFALPTSFADLLDSPSPIIVGINDNKDSLLRLNFQETYSNHNIIYLDDMSFRMAEKLSMDDSDFLTEILTRAEKQFQNFLQCMFAENTPDGEDIDMRNLGIEILESLKNTFINRIVSCLPAKPIYKQGSLSERHILDVDAILQEVSQCKSIEGYQDHFITTIFKTQGFILYLEEFYGIS